MSGAPLSDSALHLKGAPDPVAQLATKHSRFGLVVHGPSSKSGAISFYFKVC